MMPEQTVSELDLEERSKESGSNRASCDSRPHILFLNRSFTPDPTSTAQLLAELATGLTEDFQVTVIAGHPVRSSTSAGLRFREIMQAFRPNPEVLQGVHVYRCGLRTFCKSSFWGRVASYLLYFAASWRAVRNAKKADLIVAWTDPPIIGLVGLTYRRLGKSRFAMVVQDVFPEVALLMDGFRRGLTYRTLDFLSKRILRGADRVIAIGETMRQRLIDLKGLSPAKVVVIHNWEDTRHRYPTPRENPFALQEGLSADFVVMHAGNLGLSQELDSIVEAARCLREIPEIRFVFVGDGVRRAELIRRVEELKLANVKFIPHIPKHLLNEPYGAADVFIVSLKRGLAGFIVPSKLYGILAAGRPYVAAVEEECEVTAITRQYGCGLLAEPGNPKDISEKILALYRDRDMAARMGANARLAAMQFDRTKQVRAYSELFLTMIGSAMSGTA